MPSFRPSASAALQPYVGLHVEFASQSYIFGFVCGEYSLQVDVVHARQYKTDIAINKCNERSVRQ
ncbi:hypothetical protein EXIGLDRAFT_719811 [Exidia glandulosa HHB12029]|uniref:Uncharacterized protein n=1 Tax=Exidia glandulosa HHB12029 TaxID=1314781 RepID=A0A165GT84_EXIGL|nr:hypothetical protein EXIGLDRAFT_719811 [Exidia glandulosa HHB12029]